MARKPELTVEKIAEALTATKGAAVLAARKLGVSHQSIYNWIAKSPTLKALKESFDEELLDIAELKVRERILDGDADLLKFYLRTKGKHRGYTERTEHTGADGGAVVIRIKRRSDDDE